MPKLVNKDNSTGVRSSKGSAKKAIMSAMGLDTPQEVRYPIMPESSALWLIKNTKVSNRQISTFTGLHILIVDKMRKYPKEYNLATNNLETSGELSLQNIRECEADESKDLELLTYTSTTYDNVRVDIRAPSVKKLNGIKWLVDQVPMHEISDMFYNDVARFFNVSVSIVQQVKTGTHRKSNLLNGIHPVTNKIISYDHLQYLVDRYGLELNES